MRIVIAVTFALIHVSKEVDLKEDLTLTGEQKRILDKFRAMAIPYLPHEYMKRDIYLIRWLRVAARSFDINEASSMLQQNLEWRKEAKMDDILGEDWSDFERRFPYFFEGCDKWGRPVGSMPMGEWNVRSAVLSGMRPKLMRYLDKISEEINTLTRTAQEDGRNVTQYSVIYDMNNFNIFEQGCAQCIPILIYYFNSYESHWPGSVHKIYVINTPPFFESLFSLTKHLLTKSTQEAIQIFGRNKAVWRQALRKDIEGVELQRAYGGLRESGWEPNEVRAWGTMKCGEEVERNKLTLDSENDDVN